MENYKFFLKFLERKNVCNVYNVYDFKFLYNIIPNRINNYFIEFIFSATVTCIYVFNYIHLACIRLVAGQKKLTCSQNPRE